jgi:hypothetical protein
MSVNDIAYFVLKKRSYADGEIKEFTVEDSFLTKGQVSREYFPNELSRRLIIKATRGSFIPGEVIDLDDEHITKVKVCHSLHQ